jgi:hypothetical protein
LCLFFAGVRELPLVGSKIHFIDELIVFFMVSMLLRGDHGAERSSMNTFKNKTQMNKANPPPVLVCNEDSQICVCNASKKNPLSCAWFLPHTAH